jgi:hypothetical protein
MRSDSPSPPIAIPVDPQAISDTTESERRSDLIGVGLRVLLGLPLADLSAAVANLEQAYGAHIGSQRFADVELHETEGGQRLADTLEDAGASSGVDPGEDLHELG